MTTRKGRKISGGKYIQNSKKKKEKLLEQLAEIKKLTYLEQKL